MGTTRILVADHDANTRQALASYLRAHRYEVLQAVDAGQALTIAQRDHPHLIFLDGQLPGGDGHSVVPLLKAIPSCAGVPLIVLGEAGTVSAETTIFREGVTAIIRKPADPETFLAAIGQALERSYEAAERTSVRHTTHGNGRRMQPVVLAVDDDPGVRLVIRESLRAAGFDVEEAEDGMQGLAACERLAPDLVLLDVVMPHMNGFATCLAMRDLPDGAQIPIVMVTGFDDAESINRAYEAGATDFISKPLNGMLLRHRVRYLLRAGKALQALNRSERQLRRLIRKRSELALDLHDGIIQSLYAIGLGLEENRRLIEEDPGKAATQLGTAVTGLNGVIGRVRHHIVELEPDMAERAPSNVAMSPETFQRIS